jgi:hypothetical protein
MITEIFWSLDSKFCNFLCSPQLRPKPEIQGKSLETLKYFCDYAGKLIERKSKGASILNACLFRNGSGNHLKVAMT